VELRDKALKSIKIMKKKNEDNKDNDRVTIFRIDLHDPNMTREQKQMLDQTWSWLGKRIKKKNGFIIL
jgi:putative ubiquitin-RnfH superfamily antitoxin RatB of RatAB toxin-antitoxin module